MRDLPTVQIVLRTKDRALFLKRALQSIAQQTYEIWHCTLVNDGGEVQAVDTLISALPISVRDKITVIHHASSKGMEAASNVALNNFSADYYVIHDDDDSWAPDFLEKSVSYLQAKKGSSIQGVVGKTIKVKEKISKGEIQEKSTQIFLPEVKSFSIPRVLQSNPFMPIAFVYSHRALTVLKGYDETLPVVGDWEFNIRFISQFDIAFFPEAIAYYHVRIKSYGTSADNSIARALDHEHYRALIVNRIIREAISKGDLSAAQLIAFSQPSICINRFGEKIENLSMQIAKLPLFSRWFKQ